MTFDYTVEEYSCAIFIQKNNKINLSLINEFLNSTKFSINYLDTFIAKNFQRNFLISGLIDKNNKNKKNLVSSDIIFDTLRKYDLNIYYLKLQKKKLKGFIDSAKIDQLFKKN